MPFSSINFSAACSILSPIFLLLSLQWGAQATVQAKALMPSPPQLAASSYLLFDVDSGEMLVEQDADQSLPPASRTKMMTSYIVSSELKNGSIAVDDRVPISVKAWRMGGSKMFIREGSEVLLEDLLRGVIIQSGNDASVALAEHIAGDEFSFVEMMNQQAQLLGMTETHFVNATGWPAEGHVTTARDLSRLARALIDDFPQHYALYSEKEFTYNNITQPNRNGLLWRDQFVDGIKTGHTEEAGYCLVASAKRKDMRLVAIVMGAKSSRAREQEAQKLLSYGFRYFSTHRLYSEQEVISSPKLWAGAEESLNLFLDEALIVTLPRGQREDLQALIEVDKRIVAPVVAGQRYGELQLRLDDKLLATRQLIAVRAVESASWYARLWDHIVLFFIDALGLAP